MVQSFPLVLVKTSLKHFPFLQATKKCRKNNDNNNVVVVFSTKFNGESKGNGFALT